VYFRIICGSWKRKIINSRENERRRGRKPPIIGAKSLQSRQCKKKSKGTTERRRETSSHLPFLPPSLLAPLAPREALLSSLPLPSSRIRLTATLSASQAELKVSADRLLESTRRQEDCLAQSRSLSYELEQAKKVTSTEKASSDYEVRRLLAETEESRARIEE